MAWLFLLVVSLSVISAVRGEVLENFDKCNNFFFKGKPVSGLNIAMNTPTPLDGVAISKEELRKESVKLYQKMYNFLSNYKDDLNACPLNKINEFKSILQDLKSRIDNVQVNLNEIQTVSKEVNQQCKELLSELPKEPKCPKSKENLENIIKTWNEVIKQFQDFKPSVPFAEPPLKEVCLSAYEASSPAYICQKYGNNYHFATLYDRARRIPLYSAYKMDRIGTIKRKGDIVNYEPQLVHREQSESKQKSIKEMEHLITEHNQKNKCPERHPDVRRAYKLRWSQATDDDFTSFDRGHLNPAGHHAEGDASTATMTFTNVAPQSIIMNENAWNDYEIKLRLKYGGDLKSESDNNDKDRLGITQTQDCHNLYVVTGVVPGNTWQFGRVNVPSYYWSAHCCTKVEDNIEVPVLSGGAVCPNRDDGKVEEFDSVFGLEVKLTTLINGELNANLNPIRIFDECVPKIK